MKLIITRAAVLAVLLAPAMSALPAYAEQPAMEAADMVLANQVKAALDQDPDLAKLNLMVTNLKGDITIEGTMTDDQQMARAGEIAQNVPGVKNILNNMMMGK